MSPRMKPASGTAGAQSSSICAGRTSPCMLDDIPALRRVCSHVTRGHLYARAVSRTSFRPHSALVACCSSIWVGQLQTTRGKPPVEISHSNAGYSCRRLPLTCRGGAGLGRPPSLPPKGLPGTGFELQQWNVNRRPVAPQPLARRHGHSNHVVHVAGATRKRIDPERSLALLVRH